MKKILLILSFILSFSLFSQTNESDTIISPNAFTPTLNTNNEFYPKVYGYDSYTLSIYNRYGQLVYEGLSWDGRYRGQLCNRDVYVWVLVARKGSESKDYYGTVTLLSFE